MKPTILDRVIGWVSPQAGLRRMQFKAAQAVITRGYDGAKTYPTSDWVSASKSSANLEIRLARETLQQKSRDLGRNNPYALRALNVIVSNVVGAGILANIKGRNATQTKKLKALWKQVAETTLCDSQGIHNFYGLQQMAMRSVVEAGEVLGQKIITPNAPQIRLLEADFIVSNRDTVEGQIQGIEVDANGKATQYYLYKNHPGDKQGTLEQVVVSADRLMHPFRQDRPGQVRGVPWSHAVIETLKDFDDYQYATLVRQKIAACFGGFIGTNGQENLLNADELKTRRESEMQLSPGVVRYLNPGETFQNANPPGVEGYAEFTRESMRRVAAGYGVSYEAMTGDYSQVNFSSGRMGNMEFRRNIDNWRWHLLIPMFCEPYWMLFLEWAQLTGIDIEGATVDWVPPAHVMIDPAKEIGAAKDAVLAGFTSRSQVIRETGADPESVLEEIKNEREAAKAAGVAFDVDYVVPPPPQAIGQGNKPSDKANVEEAP